MPQFQAQMPDPKTYKQHFENKHPKNEVPPELKDVQPEHYTYLIHNLFIDTLKKTIT